MLDIGIALSNNSEDYLRFLIWTVKLTATSPVRFVLGVNHGADIDRVVSIIEESGFNADVFSVDVGTAYNSMNHGLCLDAVFKRMQSEIGMLVDCDVAFLQPGWDISMRSRLMKENVIIGAEYDIDVKKYREFPNVIGAMFDVKMIGSLEISFKPEGIKALKGSDFDIYGYQDVIEPISIHLDTGSELPRKIKEAGLKGIPLQIVRADQPNSKFMCAGLRGEEYQLNGIPMFTHLGRSYTRKFGENPLAVAWEKRVREWLDAC